MKDKNGIDFQVNDRVLIPAMVSGVNRDSNGKSIVALPIGPDGKPARGFELEVPATSTVKGTVESLTPAPVPPPAPKATRKISVKPGEVVELDGAAN